MGIRHPTVTGRQIFPSDYDDAHVFDGTPGKLLGADGVELDPAALSVVGTSEGVSALFTTIATVPAAVTAFTTSGYSVAGIGGARYIYDAAVNAGTVATYPRSQKMLGALGFKIDPDQTLTIEMFGGRADWNGTTGTNNLPILYEALNADIYAPQFTNLAMGATIHFGHGNYYFGDSISLRKIVTLRGTGSGQNNFVGGTRFTFPIDKTGIFINDPYTDGHTADVTQSGGGSSGSIIEGIQLCSLGGTSATAHGIFMRFRATIMRCTIGEATTQPFPGNGIHIVANSGSFGDDAFYGNANNWSINDVYIAKVGGHGLYVSGTDVNAGHVVGFETGECGGCGVLDISGLGGSLYAGLNIAGYANATPFKGRVSHGGRQYQLISTTANVGGATTPGTNQNVWYDMGAATTWPAWVSLAAYSPDIPVLMEGASNRNSIIGLYTEGGVCHVEVPSHATSCQTTFTHTSGALTHIANSFTGAVVSPTGMGGYRAYQTGGPGTTGNGAYAYSIVGGEDPLGIEYPPTLLEHRRAGDGTTSWYWGWNSTRDQTYRRLNQKNIWRITGQQTTTTFGRTTAVPYIFSVPQLAIENPANSSESRIMNICNILPTSGEIARGERYWMNAAAPGGFAENYCTTAGVLGSTAVTKTCNPVSA